VAPRRSLVSDVRDALLEELGAGGLRAGQKLPNEAELARRFEVSRPTVREALQTLIDSGHLSRRRGLGTFVTGAPRHRHSLDLTMSYTAMIRDAGMVPGERVLSKNVRPASADEAQHLGLRESARVVCVERVRTADGTPVVYSIDRLPESMLGSRADTPLDSSLYELLTECGLRVHHGVARVSPVVAEHPVAAVLEVDIGSPLLQLEELDFTLYGRPAIFSSEWHVPGVFELWVNRRAVDDLDPPSTSTVSTP
jgi:GntR family transcriptional regulator